MNDLEALLRTPRSSGPSPDDLRSYGRRVAEEFLVSRVPLNDGVARLVKEAGLNREQTQRVVEEANNTTFKMLFSKGYSQNIEFDMADTKAVLDRCNMQKTASETPRRAPLSVRSAGPPLARVLPGNTSVNAMFGLPEATLEKTASTRGPKPFDGREFVVARQKLASAKSDMAEAEMELREAMGGIVAFVKTASDEGHDPRAIGASLEAAGLPRSLHKLVRLEVGDNVEFGHLFKLAQAGFAPVPQPQVSGLVQDLEVASQKLLAASQQIQQTQFAMNSLLATLRGPTPPPGPEPVQMPGMPPPEQMQDQAAQAFQNQQMQQTGMGMASMPPGPPTEPQVY